MPNETITRTIETQSKITHLMLRRLMFIIAFDCVQLNLTFSFYNSKQLVNVCDRRLKSVALSQLRVKNVSYFILTILCD